MKKIFLIIFMCVMCFSMNVYAEILVLPDGQKLNIDNLNNTEILQAIATAKKSMKGKAAAKSVFNVVKGVDPTDLEVWSKLISGTIKTVCEDLSITVNEFVKTPVGIGVAALIAYRVAGDELISEALDIIIMIPLWFILTGFNLFLGWYFFSAKTVYRKISYDEKGKEIKEDAYQVNRYPWNTPPPSRSNDVPNQHVFGCILAFVQILGTVFTLALVLG